MSVVGGRFVQMTIRGSSTQRNASPTTPLHHFAAASQLKRQLGSHLKRFTRASASWGRT